MPQFLKIPYRSCKKSSRARQVLLFAYFEICLCFLPRRLWMNPIVLLLGDSQTPTNFDGEVGEKRASEATVILNFPFRFAWIFLAMQTWGGDTGWGGVILHRDNSC